MEFAEFATRAKEIEAESADLEVTALVTDLFREGGDDLEVLARFVQGRVFPAWESTTLDVGPRTCYEAIARAAGQNVSAADVEETLASVGEIGAVAAGYEFGGQQGLGAFTGGGPDELTVSAVSETLADLAETDGDGSQDRKIDLLFSLFNRCSSDEARYLARLVLSEMRIGVGEGTVRDAIGEAFDVPTDEVERALQVSNDYGRVAAVSRESGLEGLESMTLSVGRPVQAMLAQTGTVTDALTDWERTAVEWKYDGARIALHYDGERAWVFSRNMEDVTAALPEVVEFAEAHLERPAILDGEVVAVDEAGDPLPFQAVLRRFRRKHDVEAARTAVPVSPVFFDCLHADGEDLLEAPLTERHARLESLLRDHEDQPPEGVSALVLSDDPDEIESIDAAALEAGHEGIMLKDPNSTYSPGRRGRHWRKHKPDVETLDLVVTGAEWGEGRRATFLGTFELSVRTDDGYETVGKVATGITDETLADLTDLLEPHVRAQDGQTVTLEPAVVFEVGYEEIQVSPTYTSGYALRFPRFVGVRSDKDPEDSDCLERLERLFDAS
ncbi:ATP-dependent DNA ligase LigA [Natronobiforma cellulositropha]|uniref:ATP-dependent DNA ligase LigA n=1 Tax=Natronobiforma cellulositropha TaxID=1679076 RepID=UPI0021D5C898|nr:ATP-dependent DNA ligase LigA [Natronobiforma cellulositropha]